MRHLQHCFNLNIFVTLAYIEILYISLILRCQHSITSIKGARNVV
ncbi:hypothetical protein ALTER154_80923 [Alteromonas sp. 154]|nr:hypothetical protein ALTER154_80923 [Alteromonas sp. 154]